jgi:hypothetical protein
LGETLTLTPAIFVGVLGETLTLTHRVVCARTRKTHRNPSTQREIDR